MKKAYDLLSIGRSGVDLYGDQWGSRLEDVSSFSKSVGGCPANIAIGTSRLGLKVAMIVGDEQMGRYLRETMAAEGVDTSYIITDKERLTLIKVVFLSIANVWSAAGTCGWRLIKVVFLSIANGISGNFQASKLCTGRKLYHRMEIHGSQGAVLIDLEDINAVNVYLRESSRRLAGYRRIMAGGAHPHYDHFCPADGHGLGFNDFVTIQAASLLNAIHQDGCKPIADLTMGLRVHRVLDALIRAADTQKWVTVPA